MKFLSSHLKLTHRFYLLVGLSTLGCCILLGFAAWHLSNTLFQERGEQTRRLVESAQSIAASYAALAKAGEMTVDDAQKEAIKDLSSMRYDKDEYFWINDTSGVMLAHPKKALVGTNVLGTKDAKGADIFVDMIAIVKQTSEGPYQYYWPPDASAQPKMSYVKGVPEWGWVIGSGVFVKDVNAHVWQSVRDLAIVCLALIVALGVLAFFISRAVVRPVTSLTACVQGLAGGNTNIDVPAVERGDEIGEIARAVEIFKRNAVEKLRLEKEQEAAEAKAEVEKRAAMNKLADDFSATVGGIIETVASAATELQVSSQSMSATAEETSRQATVVAAASEQASVNVQTVASAAEQLASSVQEIGRQVAQSSQIADRAVGEADKTNAQVQMLAESAEKIGDVIKLISDIAAQTNLLALNATIEAARAGEAGKGFAVVASEVKSLATQTARATQDIAGQVKSIQSATGESVVAIDGIGKTIRSMNEIAATIAAAVEEQQAATQEIARNVQQASVGTAEVSSNIGGVSSAASEAGAASSQVLNASQDLARHSETLRGELTRFLTSVRAA